MTRVAMFDLGETLVDQDLKPFAGVDDALTTIEQFPSLEHCLLSDFDGSFADYLAELDRSGLRPHFEPVNKRVTISSIAGVRKPDRRIFAKALERLGVEATLADTIFITENAAHIAAARAMGMHALHFGRDFTNWSDVPMLIAREIGESSKKRKPPV